MNDRGYNPFIALMNELLTPEFGISLRDARLRKGLSVEEAAARLRMNPHFIEAMERGEFDLLPPDPYRKAFIKEYARLLEIKLSTQRTEQTRSTIRSAADTLEQTARKVKREAVDLTKDVVQTTKKTTETVKSKLEEGVKDLAAKELWEEAEQVRRERLGIREEESEAPANFVVRKREPTIPEQEVAALRSRRYGQIEQETIAEEEESTQRGYSGGGMSTSTKIIIGLLLVGAVILGYSLLSKRSAPTLTDSTIVTESIPAPQLKPEVKSEASKVESVQDTAESPIRDAVTADSLVFSITANDSVWVSITPDRKVGGYRGKMRQGESKSFIANHKFLLFIGNVKAITMTLNGEPIRSLPTVAGSEVVVRNVVLTKDKAYIASAEEKIFDAPKTDMDQPVSPQRVTPKPKPKPQKSGTSNKPTDVIRRKIPSVPPTLPQPN